MVEQWLGLLKKLLQISEIRMSEYCSFQVKVPSYIRTDQSRFYICVD